VEQDENQPPLHPSGNELNESNIAVLILSGSPFPLVQPLAFCQTAKEIVSKVHIDRLRL